MTPQLLDPLLGTKDKEMLRFTDMYRGFKFLDIDCNGYLSHDDIKRGLDNFPFPLNDELSLSVVEQIMKKHTDSSSGEVNYAAFVKAFAKNAQVGAAAQARAEAASMSKMQLRPGVTPEELREAQTKIKNKILEKYAGFKQAFNSIDADGSGFINRSELEGLFETLGLKEFRRPVVDTLIDFIDCEDNDGGGAGGETDIHYREFARAFATDDIMTMQALPIAGPPATPELPISATDRALGLIQSKFKPESLKNVFSFIDMDKSGTLSRKEIKRALLFWGQHMTADEIEELFVTCDKDGDGQISYLEFLEFAQRQPSLSQPRKLIKEPALPPGVTAEALRHAHKIIKQRMEAKKSFQKVFQDLDHDKSGTLDRSEIEWLVHCAVPGTDPAIVDTLVNFMDVDPGSGIELFEFCRVMSADDVMEMAPVTTRQPVVAPGSVSATPVRTPVRTRR